MMGYGDEIGIIPRMSATLFDYVAANSSKLRQWKIEISYMEIYNEQVQWRRHHLEPFLAHLSAPRHLTRDVGYTIPSGCADQVLAGAWNPML